ncbi:hypothetical protein DL89DRAFT_289782 [Linderina pennispora]|uniref:Uncharacterized protein n=1 Tax=Linderina pennispora TaxID=61395 RepID=A0A1Y1WL06_9FUNG|nr:uncharacterized protein DL89DRAFT_289782 [Linderina pennispora]ORX74163.1 hypothetical protein DL89DRAFT_289782 [Linderina pennispora]
MCSSEGSRDTVQTSCKALSKPTATLLTPDGGVLATRVHYETLNDALFLLKATLFASVLCLLAFVILSLASANVDIRLGMLAVTTYPKLLFSSPVWSSTSVFAAIQVVWFLVYCLFSHIIRLHFNTADPPRDWDDRNGEWCVVELDVRLGNKPTEVAECEVEQEDGEFRSAADQWKLCVLPTQQQSLFAGVPVQIALLTPDPELLAWKRREKTRRAAGSA